MERRLAVEAMTELTRASLELRLMPKRKSVALLGTVSRGRTDEHVAAAELQAARRIGYAVARQARRLPWQPTCLRQALAMRRMLDRRNIPGRLHLGVRGRAEREAHAWVTVAGQPVLGGQGIESYVPLAAFE
jgi:hypothetical protein